MHIVLTEDEKKINEILSLNLKQEGENIYLAYEDKFYLSFAP